MHMNVDMLMDAVFTARFFLKQERSTTPQTWVLQALTAVSHALFYAACSALLEHINVQYAEHREWRSMPTPGRFAPAAG